MFFQTHNQVPSDKPIQVFDLCLQGSIQATYGQMVAAFGEPLQINEARASVEWQLQFADGTRANIYDWNRGSEQDRDFVFGWRIGGTSPHCVGLVHQAFRRLHGLRARAA